MCVVYSPNGVSQVKWEISSPMTVLIYIFQEILKVYRTYHFVVKLSKLTKFAMVYIT